MEGMKGVEGWWGWGWVGGDGGRVKRAKRYAICGRSRKNVMFTAFKFKISSQFSWASPLKEATRVLQWNNSTNEAFRETLKNINTIWYTNDWPTQKQNCKFSFLKFSTAWSVLKCQPIILIGPAHSLALIELISLSVWKIYGNLFPFFSSSSFV